MNKPHFKNNWWEPKTSSGDAYGAVAAHELWTSYVTQPDTWNSFIKHMTGFLRNTDMSASKSIGGKSQNNLENVMSMIKGGDILFVRDNLEEHYERVASQKPYPDQKAHIENYAAALTLLNHFIQKACPAEHIRQYEKEKNAYRKWRAFEEAKHADSEALERPESLSAPLFEVAPALYNAQTILNKELRSFINTMQKKQDSVLTAR